MKKTSKKYHKGGSGAFLVTVVSCGRRRPAHDPHRSPPLTDGQSTLISEYAFFRLVSTRGGWQ